MDNLIATFMSVTCADYVAIGIDAEGQAIAVIGMPDGETFIGDSDDLARYIDMVNGHIEPDDRGIMLMPIEEERMGWTGN